MDKKLSFILTGKTLDLDKSITVSAQKISDFGKMAMKTSEKASESFGNITVSAEKTEGKLKKLSSSAKDWMKAAFSVEAVKKCISALSIFWGKLTEISRKASELGTSASFFQKLEKASASANEEFSKVEDVFNNINSAVRKAAAGDKEYIASLKRIGVSIDDIRMMRPDEIFLYVSSAINRLGNTAEEQQNKIAVCGESILAVGNSLEKINGIGNDGIIPDSAVQSAVAIKESFESIKNSAMGLAEKLGVFKLLEKAARQLEEANAEFQALKDKFSGNDKTPYKTWNETQVSAENKKAAAEFDEKYRNSQRQVWMSIPASARPLTPPALPIDKDGLTPGQAKYKYDPVTNPHGFKASTDSAPLTKEELSAAKAKLRSKREEEKKQDEKQKAVIAEQTAKDAEERRRKFEEALAEERKTPYQKKIEAINADYGKKMAEATEIYGSQEIIPENVMAQLKWQRQMQLSEATASFQKAQTRNQVVMRPIYNARINNAPRNVAGGGMDIRAMVEQQRRTNELLAKGNYIKVRN